MRISLAQRYFQSIIRPSTIAFPDITVAHPSGSSPNQRSFHEKVLICHASSHRSVLMVSSRVTISLAT